MPRIPLIKFPKRNLKAPSPSAPGAPSCLHPITLLFPHMIPYKFSKFLRFFGFYLLVAAASQPADQHATLMSRLAAKVAPPSGEIKNYRFRSDVPSPPSHTAVGGPASLLPKRKPLTEEEIEAIMLGGSI
ncbi:unnamed protein product [Urochloa decumbens]|uniref:Uncharacterized protein n=1 Tax=Urochloa decumbens TaxID=240449 RepID=A0ABC9DG46_9POAL